MINSFGDKDTARIWRGEPSYKLPFEIQEIGRRKLRMLNNAQSIQDLRAPPSNRLEKLKGNLEYYFSIRINNKWRILFQWSNGNLEKVSIIDYQK